MKTSNKMVITMKALNCLLICLTTLAFNLASGQQPPAPPAANPLKNDAKAAPPETPVLTKFNLDFPGGTPGELLTAIQKEIGKPLSVKIRKTFGRDLSFFLIKIAAGTICLIVVLNFLFIRAERFIETNSMDKIIGRSWKVETLVGIVNQKLTEIPEDGKERIRMQLKSIAEQIKPDVDEIMTVWEEKTTLKESGQTKGKK